MANYYCVMRTNYFRVKDEEKFLELMENVCSGEDELQIWSETDAEGAKRFGFGVYDSIRGINLTGDEDEDYTEEDEEKRSSSARKRPESEKARTKLQTEPDSGMTEISDSSEQGEEDLEPEEKEIGTDSLPDVQAALEAALENQPLNRTSEDYTLQQPEKPDASQKEETEARDEIELAMPAHTAEELLEKAYADGLDPKLKKDETTGVTLVDYSDSL